MAGEILVQGGFTVDAISGERFVRLVREHRLGFEPTQIRAGGTVRFSDAALSRLASDRPVTRAGVQIELSQYFNVSRARQCFQQVLWVHDDLDIVDDLVESLIRIPGLAAVYAGSSEDFYWQSEESIQNFESAGRPHAHLPKVPGGMLPGETEQIDTSQNWGRAAQVGYLWAWAASRMWFGPEAFRWLDRERLLQLPIGVIDDVGGGVVRVDLFPWAWYTTDVEAMRERQRVFWDWMGFADLETRADEILEALTERAPSELPALPVDEAPIIRDAVTAAEWVAGAMRSSGYATDFSPVSLWEIDRFFAEQLKRPGKPRRGGLLAEDLGSRIFAIGAYVGEVIRRGARHAWDWAPGEGGPDDEIGLRLVRRDDGAVLWPVQRVMKRYAEGEANGIAVYASALTGIEIPSG